MKISKSIISLFLGIVILAVAQTAAQLAGSFIVFIGFSKALSYIVFASVYIGGVYLLGKILCEKVLAISLSDCRISQIKVRRIWIFCAVALPAAVSAILLLFPGEMIVQPMSLEEKISTVCLAVFYYGLGAGFAEEMIFRGIIMKVLENCFGKKAAIIIPSVIFGLIHTTDGMNVKDMLILFIAGTSVGIMFSLITYASGTIWASAIVHAIWNTVMIGGILNIGVEHTADAIFSYKLTSTSLLITGGTFGVEASVVAIGGYLLVSLFAVHQKAQGANSYYSRPSR